MAKKRDGFLSVVEEKKSFFYSDTSSRPLPQWMKDKSLLPKRPPSPVKDKKKSSEA
jgi:hypothetical protein